MFPDLPGAELGTTRAELPLLICRPEPVAAAHSLSEGRDPINVLPEAAQSALGFAYSVKTSSIQHEPVLTSNQVLGDGNGRQFFSRGG